MFKASNYITKLLVKRPAIEPVAEELKGKRPAQLIKAMMAHNGEQMIRHGSGNRLCDRQFGGIAQSQARSGELREQGYKRWNLRHRSAEADV